ncbi:stage II sporulation protein P [Thermaerobacter litoralis]
MRMAPPTAGAKAPAQADPPATAQPQEGDPASTSPPVPSPRRTAPEPAGAEGLPVSGDAGAPVPAPPGKGTGPEWAATAPPALGRPALRRAAPDRRGAGGTTGQAAARDPRGRETTAQGTGIAGTTRRLAPADPGPAAGAGPRRAEEPAHAAAEMAATAATGPAGGWAGTAAAAPAGAAAAPTGAGAGRGPGVAAGAGAAGTPRDGAAAPPRDGTAGAAPDAAAGRSGDGGGGTAPGGDPDRPSPGRRPADPWALIATYAGLVAAVFLFLAGLGGGLPWDRSHPPGAGAPGSPVAGEQVPGAPGREPAVPALSGAGGAGDPASGAGAGSGDTGAPQGSGGGAGGGSTPGLAGGAAPGAAAGPAEPAEPDLWQALGERLWGWRAALRAVWPGSSGDGGPEGADLGRRLVHLLTEKVSGVRLDEPLTLVAAQFPGEHHLEVFEEEGGPVVGRLAPPDILAGGLPRFRPPAAAAGGDEVAVTGDRPRVLIYHTHTSEAYVGAVPAGAGFDPAVEAFTSDPGASVVGAGAVIQQVLEERGIGAVHLRQVFDRDGQRVTRIGNYQRSLKALVGGGDEPGVLDRYPSVDVVVDVHRDGIPRESTVVRVGGQPAAGILFVVGTDRRLEHPQWKKNYCFVQWLVAELNRRYPGLVKGVLVSDNRYNQHVRPGAVLVEIGGYGNTPQEADRSARMFAEALAAVIEAGKVPQADRPFQCPPGVAPPR